MVYHLKCQKQEKKSDSKWLPKHRGFVFPQTLSLLARKLVFRVSSLLPMVRALSPVVIGWQREHHQLRTPRVLGPSIIRHIGHMSLSGFMIGKSCWLLLEGQISLRFMACMGSDGDLNRNLGTVWKGQVERMPHGHPAMSRRGGTPRAPYPPSPGLF